MRKHIVSAVLLVALFFVVAASKEAAAANTPLQGHEGQYSDKDYLSGLKAFYQGTTDIAAGIVGVTKDPTLKDMAEEILKDNKEDLGKVEALLARAGGVDDTAYATILRMSASVEKGKDAAFAQGMFEHQVVVVNMSASALMYSKDPAVIKLAEDVLSDHAEEMADIRLWQIRQAK